jgi:hypothetical protein
MFYPDKIIEFTPLADVFCTVGGGNSSTGSKLLHSTHVIFTIYGDMTMYQALSNSRSDGFGALARQSGAAILNSYCRPVQYNFTPIQVRLNFRKALVDEHSAFQMAREFEAANTALSAEHSNVVVDSYSFQEVSNLQSHASDQMVQNQVRVHFNDAD